MKINIFKISALILFSFLLVEVVLGQSNSPQNYSLKEALEIAKESDKKVLIDVYAEWCPYCQEMHSEVYTDSRVIDIIESNFILVKINIESEEMVNYLGTEMTEREFALALQSTSTPTTYFMQGDGSLLGKQPGKIPAEMFSNLLKFVGSDAYLNQTFDEFRNRD